MVSDAKVKEAAGLLRSVLVWAEDKLDDYDDVVPRQEEVLARYQPVFAPENVESLTEEEFRSFLQFENNHHWWFPPFHIPSICEDMDLLRETLGILVDDDRPIRDRLGLVMPESGPMVPYMGRAIITAILLVRYPDAYGVWNGRSEASLKASGTFPDISGSAPFSQRYLAFNEVLTELADATGVDLWTLDFLHYAREKYEQTLGEDEGRELPELDADWQADDTRFGLEQHLHDFMRDNWDGLELSNEWALHMEDGELVGYKYVAGAVGEIDLLAHHRSEPRWLVIELKRNQSSDQTVGQVLRYMGWVTDELAGPDESVEGLIIAHASDDRIRYALRHTNGVSLKLYRLDFHLIEPEH